MHNLLGNFCAEAHHILNTDIFLIMSLQSGSHSEIIPTDIALRLENLKVIADSDIKRKMYFFQ